MKRPSAPAVLPIVLVAIASGIAGCDSLGTRPVNSYAPTLDVAVPPLRGLRGQFFGTATVLIRDDKNAILVDGFFSRPGILELVLGNIEPNLDRIEQELRHHVDASSIDYVLVSHSHYDHAMDAPIVADKTHATLVGSESTHNIARGSRPNVPFHLALPGDHLERGAFKITFFKTEHAPYQFEDLPRRSTDILDPLRAWLDHMLAGTIDRPLPTPVRFTEYKVGFNYVFLIEHPHGRILIVPSASVPPLGLGDIKVDVVFLSIGDADKLSNEHIVSYWKEAVADTGAKLVVPMHWDNLSGSLEAPLEPAPSFFDNVACAMETITFLNAGRVAIRFMPLREPVVLNVTRIGTLEHNSGPKSAGAINPFTDGCRKGRD